MLVIKHVRGDRTTAFLYKKHDFKNYVKEENIYQFVGHKKKVSID